MKPASLALAILLSLPLQAWTDRKPNDTDDKSSESRAALIARAKVWTPTHIESMNLFIGPTGRGAFAPREMVTCDYDDEKFGGSSPKFLCVLPDGDELKVKYGGSNGEVYGEVAASRLLWALGFGADHMYPVRVVCRGCPRWVGGTVRSNGDHILDPAAIERKMPGEELSDRWHWDELDKVDPSAGGAPVSERDAFKLLAVLIHHTDSKPNQQRLVCLDPPADEKGRCKTPLMMINDLGISFGRGNALNEQPRASVNLAEWADLPIWKDAKACIGNLSGSVKGSLENPVIGEAGRKFLAGLLTRLSDRQLRDMFEAARVQLRPRAPESGRSGFATVDEWVQAFKEKRAQIADRRCDA